MPALGVPRPGGGAPASVGILLVDDGALELEPMTPAPKALADVDVSLDWPKTARALMTAVEESGSEPVDGVILIDAVGLQDLVWVIGDVKVDGRPLALSVQSTTAVLEIDAFLGDAPPKAAQLHADRASEILDAFLERRPGVESLALAAAADTRGRHLSVSFLGKKSANSSARWASTDERD